MTIGFLGGKFLPLHRGHMFAIMQASTMVDKLYVVLSSSVNRDSELCERDGVKFMPADVRMSWLGASVSNISNIEIINIIDDQWDADYDWEDGARKIRLAIPEKLTHVFSSESEYNSKFKKYYPEAQHIVLDESRLMVSISATDLRKHLYDHWDMLPETVRAFFVKKIVVVGTESCGKSTLVKKLASFYNTNYIHEVGKDDYCIKYKNQLTVKMFDSIAMDQYRLIEKKSLYSNKLLIIDTEAIVTQYYLNIYKDCKSNLIDEIIKAQSFDLMLYLEPDVKWIDDGLRMFSEDSKRKIENERLKKMFLSYGYNNLTFIKGSYEQRFKDSIEIINKLMKGEII